MSARRPCERMSMRGCPHPNMDISAPRVLMLHAHLTWPGFTAEWTERTRCGGGLPTPVGQTCYYLHSCKPTYSLECVHPPRGCADARVTSRSEPSPALPERRTASFDGANALYGRPVP
eukprot:5256024-Prymnesium_polylepis.1